MIFFFMDNGGITSSKSLVHSYTLLAKIFEPFGFKLQEYVTNDKSVLEKFPSVSENQPAESKFLGMIWNTEKDTISPPKFKLDLNANTKRSVLSSIASNFDIFNIGGPILNRARIFVHELQCNSKLNWDTKLDKESLKMWFNIANQVNVTPELHIDRFVGDRNVACFTTSSLEGAM